MLGEGAASADVQAARHAYGLDVPLPQQYVNYWKGVLRGDLGRSLRFDQPVTGVILQRYPKTLLLTVASMIVALLISIPAGVRSARRRNRWDDRLLSVVSLWGLSFPNFAMGPILILFFAIRLGLLPVSGYGTVAHLVLPAITMGGSLAAILTRMVRTAMLEELGQDYACYGLIKTERTAEVSAQHAFPVVHILLWERDVESIGVPGGLHVGAGCAFSQHLLDGIAGNKMDQQKNHRHDEPDDGNHVKQAGCDVAEHGRAGNYGSKSP